MYRNTHHVSDDDIDVRIFKRHLSYAPFNQINFSFVRLFIEISFRSVYSFIVIITADNESFRKCDRCLNIETVQVSRLASFSDAFNKHTLNKNFSKYHLDRYRTSATHRVHNDIAWLWIRQTYQTVAYRGSESRWTKVYDVTTMFRLVSNTKTRC